MMPPKKVLRTISSRIDSKIEGGRHCTEVKKYCRRIGNVHISLQSQYVPDCGYAHKYGLSEATEETCNVSCDNIVLTWEKCSSYSDIVAWKSDER